MTEATYETIEVDAEGQTVSTPLTFVPGENYTELYQDDIGVVQTDRVYVVDGDVRAECYGASHGELILFEYIAEGVPHKEPGWFGRIVDSSAGFPTAAEAKEHEPNGDVVYDRRDDE